MQKFHKGDHVQIAKDLGPSMSHFTADCEAIVIGSYADQYNGGDTNSYTLFIKNKGRTSWYHGEQLTLIATGQLGLLDAWEQERAERDSLHADIDWIFANGHAVLAGASGAAVATLASGFGLDNLWGPRGEGFVYYRNAQFTLKLAKPFLLTGDKAGWLSRCADIKTLIDAGKTGYMPAT